MYQSNYLNRPSKSIHTRCVICLSTVLSDSLFARCPSCRYSFHESHLNTWLRAKSVCPTCLTALPDWFLSYYRIPHVDTTQAHLEITDIDPTGNRAPSKSHRSYFDDPITYSNRACSCNAWRSNPTTFEINSSAARSHIWVIGLLSYILFVAINLYVMYITAISVGKLVGKDDLLFVLFVYVIVIPVVFLFCLKLLIFLYSRLNCPQHHIWVF